MIIDDFMSSEVVSEIDTFFAFPWSLKQDCQKELGNKKLVENFNTDIELEDCITIYLKVSSMNGAFVSVLQVCARNCYIWTLPYQTFHVKYNQMDSLFVPDAWPIWEKNESSSNSGINWIIVMFLIRTMWAPSELHVQSGVVSWL